MKKHECERCGSIIHADEYDAVPDEVLCDDCMREDWEEDLHQLNWEYERSRF